MYGTAGAAYNRYILIGWDREKTVRGFSMLDSLSGKFRKVLKDVRGQGKLSKSNVEETLKRGAPCVC